jgi:hypothetical protein
MGAHRAFSTYCASEDALQRELSVINKASGELSLGLHDNNMLVIPKSSSGVELSIASNFSADPNVKILQIVAPAKMFFVFREHF